MLQRHCRVPNIPPPYNPCGDPKYPGKVSTSVEESGGNIPETLTYESIASETGGSPAQLPTLPARLFPDVSLARLDWSTQPPIRRPGLEARMLRMPSRRQALASQHLSKIPSRLSSHVLFSWANAWSHGSGSGEVGGTKFRASFRLILVALILQIAPILPMRSTSSTKVSTFLRRRLSTAANNLEKSG